jgi:hypothetical protein
VLQEAGFDLHALKAMDTGEIDFWFDELVKYREAVKDQMERDR